ncbi:hypothetical protein FOL47_009187 [Perkinsus chesapeaki]|uniref:C3H1-type domain-containing protein n=1 Tax=Perkinsus chesapeaki TaxID=330153 RepID=A0A7J6L9Z1_PERCH|nr:hypothetical protein FOL47_009187 [Perkinsus chesapeaki]
MRSDRDFLSSYKQLAVVIKGCQCHMGDPQSSSSAYDATQWSSTWGGDQWYGGNGGGGGWSNTGQWGNWNDEWYGGWSGKGIPYNNQWNNGGDWWPTSKGQTDPSWGKGYDGKGKGWGSKGGGYNGSWNGDKIGKGKGKGKGKRRMGEVANNDHWGHHSPAAKKGRFSMDSTDEPPKSEFYCKPCGKDLFTADALDEHVLTFHVTCPHPGCDYSARPDLVAAHKLSHCLVTTAEGKSESLTASQAETEAWLARRKKNFPSKDKSDTPKDPTDASEMCTLERAIRASMRENRERKKKERAERAAKFAERRVCTHFAKFGKCKYGDACHFEHVQPKKGICRFFQEKGYCRHGDNCKFNHVKQKPQEQQESMKEQLIRRLMRDDIERYNATVLQCLRFFVTENFFDEKTNDETVADEDGCAVESESDNDTDDDYLSDDEDDTVYLCRCSLLSPMDAFQAARAAYLRGRGHSSHDGDGMAHKGGLTSAGNGLLLMEVVDGVVKVVEDILTIGMKARNGLGMGQEEDPLQVDQTGGSPPLPPRGGRGLFWEDALGTLPKDSQFYCEPCEMDLCTAEALDKHKLTYHVKCPQPGCDYSAPPYMVESHKWTHMDKSEGDGVASFPQPEETRVWLEERRKNFPGATKKRQSEMVAVESLKEVSESSSDSSDEEDSEDTVVTSSDDQSDGNVEEGLKEHEKGKSKGGVDPSLTDDGNEVSTPAAAAAGAAAAASIGVIKAPSEEENGQKVTKPKHGMCRFFLERGRCRHGDNCKYKHVRLTRQNKKKKPNHKQLVDQLKTFLAEEDAEEESESESDSDSDEAT